MSLGNDSGDPVPVTCRPIENPPDALAAAGSLAGEIDRLDVQTHSAGIQQFGEFVLQHSATDAFLDMRSGTPRLVPGRVTLTGQLLDAPTH